MPRVALAALQGAQIDVRRDRLTPRQGFPESLSRAFTELVGSVGPDHFCEADRPLLEAMATAVCMSREASAHVEEHGLMLPNGKPNPAGKVLLENQKLIKQLATALRLTPQSRISADKAGTTTRDADDQEDAEMATARRIDEGWV